MYSISKKDISKALKRKYWARRRRRTKKGRKKGRRDDGRDGGRYRGHTWVPHLLCPIMLQRHTIISSTLSQGSASSLFSPSHCKLGTCPVHTFSGNTGCRQMPDLVTCDFLMSASWFLLPSSPSLCAAPALPVSRGLACPTVSRLSTFWYNPYSTHRLFLFSLLFYWCCLYSHLRNITYKKMLRDHVARIRLATFHSFENYRTENKTAYKKEAIFRFKNTV